MFLAITFVFALVTCVGLLVVVAWSISEIAKLEEQAVRMQEQLRGESARLMSAVERTTNSKLAAELDALRGALDVMRNSNRREMSTLWGRLGARKAAILDGETGEPLEGDDELQAMLRLQTAKSAGPGQG